MGDSTDSSSGCSTGCCNSSGVNSAHLLSHINSLECRLSKQRCWLTLITIIVVGVITFAMGFMAGRCCANKCKSAGPSCGPVAGACAVAAPATPCGPMGGPQCFAVPGQGGPGGPNAMFFGSASGGPDCGPGGQMQQDIFMKVLGGPDGGNGITRTFTKRIVVDSNGKVVTIDEDDGEDEDEDDDDDDDAAPAAPVAPAP